MAVSSFIDFDNLLCNSHVHYTCSIDNVGDSLCVELTGVNCAEWNSLFNGQLDDMSSTLDPMTGGQNSVQPDTTMLSANPQPSSQPPHIDR